jgi:Cu-Zn family superoxide dismutase
MNYVKSAFILSSLCLMCACTPKTTSVSQTNTEAEGETVQRKILNAARVSLGSVSLRDLGAMGTEVTVNITGLDGAGTHAMHFHEKGLCDAPDFASSGGHYNPTEMQHGTMSPGGPHAGDMMNIDVNSNGTGTLSVVNNRVSIKGEHGLPALFDEDGSALIIHAKADDYTSQPSGAAGARIGCAVLEARKYN